MKKLRIENEPKLAKKSAIRAFHSLPLRNSMHILYITSDFSDNINMHSSNTLTLQFTCLA